MAAPDPRQRLLELAGERGVSLTQLSALIGRNASYLQQFVRKGSPRKLEETDRATLARFFAVSEGELGASEEKSSASDWVDIRRLALGASAGPGALAPDEQAIGAVRFSRAWLRRQGLEPARLSAIVVDGDSMEPVLRDGDEILVDATARPLRDGVHVVRVGDALLVKRLETGRPGVIVLKSDNPAYDPIELAFQDVQVVGRVVWKGGRL
jgi:phage repressor protein C with HTH and peptisase S24 domain